MLMADPRDAVLAGAERESGPKFMTVKWLFRIVWDYLGSSSPSCSGIVPADLTTHIRLGFEEGSRTRRRRTDCHDVVTTIELVAL